MASFIAIPRKPGHERVSKVWRAPGLRELIIYAQLFWPGLVQAHDYARVILATAPEQLSHQELEARLNLRLREQAGILERDPPLELVIVVDESVLWRVEPSERALLAEQLRHVLDLSEKFSNVELRVVPFDSEDGVAAGACWPQLLLAYGTGPEFPKDRVVFRERHFNDEFFDGTDGTETELELAEWTLDVIKRQALSSEETLARIRAKLQELVA